MTRSHHQCVQVIRSRSYTRAPGYSLDKGKRERGREADRESSPYTPVRHIHTVIQFFREERGSIDWRHAHAIQVHACAQPFNSDITVFYLQKKNRRERCSPKICFNSLELSFYSLALSSNSCWSSGLRWFEHNSAGRLIEDIIRDTLQIFLTKSQQQDCDSNFRKRAKLPAKV